jgi:hypothetical protein
MLAATTALFGRMLLHGLFGRMRLAAATLLEVSLCGMGGCGSS